LGRVRWANRNDQEGISFVRVEKRWMAWTAAIAASRCCATAEFVVNTSFFYFVGTYRRILSLLCGDVQHGS